MSGRNVCEVIGAKPFGSCVELEIDVGTAFEAEPGQFVHVRCAAPGLILRRPYSLYGLGGGTASLLVRRVGAGSRWLCGLGPGERLDFLGPLGRGFTVEGGGRHLLVAGGTGIAPLRFLAARMMARGIEPVLYWGVEGEEEYSGLPAVLEKDLDLRLACMDGSVGYRGSVLELFAQEESGEGQGSIYACGPRGMLAGLAENIDRERITHLQICMEERMACGVGACRGCAVPATPPRGGYLAACSDGPVFYGRELDWERMMEED